MTIAVDLGRKATKQNYAKSTLCRYIGESAQPITVNNQVVNLLCINGLKLRNGQDQELENINLIITCAVAMVECGHKINCMNRADKRGFSIPTEKHLKAVVYQYHTRYDL